MKKKFVYCEDDNKIVDFNTDCINCTKYTSCPNREQFSIKGMIKLVFFSSIITIFMIWVFLF